MAFEIDRLTNEESDAQYDVVRSTPPEIFMSVLREYREQSAAALRLPGAKADILFDEESGATLDIFQAEGRGSKPTFIYMHGGGWQALSSKDAAFMAPAMNAAGINVIAVDYALFPTVSLDEIVRQVRSALVWVFANARSFEIDPSRLNISGSSSGAHLAAMATAGGWKRSAGVPDELLAGAFLFSGLYDLMPVQRSSMNDSLCLSEQSARRLSPSLLPPDGVLATHIYWGLQQPDVYKAQSRHYAERLRNAGHIVHEMELPGRNHFDDVFELADPESSIFADVVGLLTSTKTKN